MNKKHKLSALVIAKNESKMIGSCIDCLQWCDEVIILDSGSTDDTREIAESHGAKVVSFSHQSFSRLREEALKWSNYEWVFYVDADERVTPTLAKEIKVAIETTQENALIIKRNNYHFGRLFKYGGWQNDLVTRVFKKEHLQGWQGEIHESPIYTGRAKKLQTSLYHLTHRSVVEGLRKTIEWTPLEARAIAEQKTTITFWIVLRKGIMEFVRRALFNRGYRDGMPGLIEAITQGLNRFLVYIQAWEFQQKPPIHDHYLALEAEVSELWAKLTNDEKIKPSKQE